MAQATQFEYNARSQMTKVTDALNQQYVFTYDPLGRQLSETRAGTTMSYEYDAVGNRTKRTDHLARETTYEYDVLNRLKKINYLQSLNGIPPQTPIATATYSYDDLSRLVSAGTKPERLVLHTTTAIDLRPKRMSPVIDRVWLQRGESSEAVEARWADIQTSYDYDIADRLDRDYKCLIGRQTVGLGYDNEIADIQERYPK